MALFDIQRLKDNIKSDKRKKETATLIVLVLVFIFTVYIFLFFKPAFAKFMALNPKVSTRRIELKTALDDIENRLALENKKASLESKIEYYEKRLPNQQEIPKLLEDLSAIAIESGAKILGIKPIVTPDKEEEGASKEEIYQELPIKIDAKCGYHQLGRFIQKLEGSDRFMKVTSIYVETNPSDINKHNVQLMITTYTLTRGVK